MARTGLRKLVDLPYESQVLDRFLAAYDIDYEIHDHDGFVRYFVQSRDLCCAQTALPAIEAIIERKPPGRESRTEVA